MYETQTIKVVIQTEGNISGNIFIENNDLLHYNRLLRNICPFSFKFIVFLLPYWFLQNVLIHVFRLNYDW